MKTTITLNELLEYIKEEVKAERETIKEEPCNSHIGSMAGGALDAYYRIFEYLEES